MNETSGKPSNAFKAGALFAVLAAMSSGLMLPLGKPDAASAGTLVFLFGICAVAAVINAPALLRRRSLVAMLSSKRVIYGFLSHTFLCVLALILLWEGTSRINPAIAGFLSNMHVIFAVLLSLVVLGEPIGRSTLAGGVLILGGLVVMRGDAVSELNLISMIDRDWILVIASAAVFAMADLAIKMTALDVDMFAYLGARNILLALTFGGLCLLTDQSIRWSRLMEPATIGTAVFGIIGSRLFFNLALQRISLSRSSLIFQIQPLFVALFAFFLSGELPQNHEWLGGMVIMAGVTIVLRR